LNEVNFDFVKVYAGQGTLPHLARLIERHGVAETTSEKTYEELEPWIQWVTAHTGLTLDEHRVFRLGDIANHDFVQIWERLEEEGFRTGAISPMNAKNRLRNPAFFVPDPWTETESSAPAVLKRLYAGIRQAVNDNAQARLTPTTLVSLLAGALRYARRANFRQYGSLMALTSKRPWTKAMVLDLLLADVFITEVQRTRPDFATLFLNAAAHIQHHYMFNSPAYKGNLRNPSWYISGDKDPVREVYRLYDHILGQVLAVFPDVRLMIATGLHQVPHECVTFYWRLKNHETFLRKIGLPFRLVRPRMSRDFLVECHSEEEAARAGQLLSSARSEDGTRLFEVDNRGRDLFVTLDWPNDIGFDFRYVVDSHWFSGLRDDVVFVAIKNGQHDGLGYFLDTGAEAENSCRFPLAELPGRICAAFGIDRQI
jgi:hypothetical protein